jgi:elongation factor Ts
MSAISALLVKDLRDKTGAGMADCKRALEEAGGDMQGAIEWLRKRGAASVAKRADREANEGIVTTRTTADGKTAAIVEVNCETDFVARNEEFVNFSNAIADAVLANDIKSEDELWAISTGDKTLGNIKDEILAKFSEKIGLRRFEHRTTSGSFVAYIHAGSRLGVLLELDGSIPEEAKPLGRDIAMQVAAMNPMFVNRSQVDQGTLDKELEIYKAAAIQEGKKEEIAERVAQGKLGKFYEEQVLVEQVFVKDSSKKVSDVVADISKLAGATINVVSFRRYNIGEK